VLAFSSRLGGRDGLSGHACGSDVGSSFLCSGAADVVNCCSMNALELVAPCGVGMCCPGMSSVHMSMLTVVG
jgi:hypothetical protein